MSTVPTGCPVAEWFTPGETSAHPDAFPWYARLREAGPVVFVPSGGGAYANGMYVVTRYEEVAEVLRDPITYSVAAGMGIAKPPPAEILAQANSEQWDPRMPDISRMDPPEHTRLRKLLNPAFTPRRLAVFEDSIREVANARIDAFIAHGQADLDAEFASRIPNMAIGRIIGADEEVADQRFVAWLDAFLRLSVLARPEEEELPDWYLVLEQDRYLRSLVEERRRNPANDLTTDMIQATTDDGEPALTDEEIVVNLLAFIGAGSGTTATMFVNTMYLLLTHPEQLEAVRSDPQLVPAAIEEGLRLRSVARGLPRTATKHTELAGVPIPKGAQVYVTLASANNDEDRFDSPETFDIHRANRRDHLGFGKWTHFCIGAPLARLEGRVAIETLLERLPGLRLAPDYATDFGYEDNLVVAPIRALRVEWD